MQKIVHFVLEKIGIKFGTYKLKTIIDWGFVLVEKVIFKLNNLLPIYLDFYNEMVDNEIRLASITKNDKILHIGFGSIPATSILIAKKTEAKIVGIDKNPRTVKEALSLLSKLKLSDKIEIKHAEALHFPVEPYDVILVSQGVQSNVDVLKHIAKSMKNNARVIFRTSSSEQGDLTENDMFLKDIFLIKGMVSQKQNGLLISVMLLKK